MDMPSHLEPKDVALARWWVVPGQKYVGAVRQRGVSEHDTLLLA